MSFHHFWIPARRPESEQERLNAFLRSHRVIAVVRHFHGGDPAGEPGWAAAVECALGPSPGALRPASGGKKIDYREVMSPEDFLGFSAPRSWRKSAASDEGVPIYGILTNEQLAEISRKRCRSVAELEQVAGIGPTRLARYGASILEVVLGSPTPAVPAPGGPA